YTFTPTNMTVMKGDYIGLATVGGGFKIAAGDQFGSDTYDFTGHAQDMNGATIRPTVTEASVQLLLQVDLAPPPPPPPPPTTTTKRPPTTKVKKPVTVELKKKK